MGLVAVAEALVAAAAHDSATRERLARSGELWSQGYHPEMESVHRANATLLHAILAEHGWPDAGRFGADAADAAWLIAQHAIGDPPLQRAALAALRAQPDAEPWRAAMLEDRIACLEGRPQRYGTQHDWDDAGQLSPSPLEDAAQVDAWRAEVGLEPLADRTAFLRAQAEAGGEKPPADPEARRREADAWARRVGWR